MRRVFRCSERCIDLGSESRIHVPDELWVMLHEGLITCIGYLDP